MWRSHLTERWLNERDALRDCRINLFVADRWVLQLNPIIACIAQKIQHRSAPERHWRVEWDTKDPIRIAYGNVSQVVLTRRLGDRCEQRRLPKRQEGEVFDAEVLNRCSANPVGA